MKYSNGVEARVGDVFRNLEGIVDTVKGFDDDGDVIGDIGSFYTAECCLMHRPFKEKDMVCLETYCHEGGCGIEHMLYSKAKLLTNIPSQAIPIEHTNPLWRDHPDYVKEQK